MREPLHRLLTAVVAILALLGTAPCAARQDVTPTNVTSIGAIIGLVGGAGVAALINALSPIPAAVPIPAIVAALLGSAFTGILFGMMPSARAARLDPVEALRYE